MNKTKAVKKDLTIKFAGTINEVVNQEDPKPSKKVKRLIKKSSRRLATAVLDDTKKAKKRAEKDGKKSLKAEKKAAKAEKKASLNGSKPKKENKESVEVIG
jgi:hypothetical protein